MNRDLTKGPAVRSMLLFAIPMILGDLLQQCYNIADTLIVGQFLGRDALAAFGLFYKNLSRHQRKSGLSRKGNYSSRRQPRMFIKL